MKICRIITLYNSIVVYYNIILIKGGEKMKKKLVRPNTSKVKALKKVALYETYLRGSVDENCSSPGSQYNKCKNKCC